MKVLAMIGSPRKKNTKKLVERLFSDIKADKEIVYLSQMNIGLCCGNEACMESGKCVKSDDFDLLADKMQNAQVLIFASPSYFNNVTALMKNFIDRCNVLCNNKAFEDKGKRAVLMAIGADEKRHIIGTITALRNLCGGIYLDVLDELIIESDDIEAKADEIRELGEKIDACA